MVLKKNQVNNKKGQEEMVGFVIIIILVSVIGLIFLSFSLDDSGTGTMDNEEVESFILALGKVTTECTDENGYYRNIQELILDCDKNRECADGKNSCNVLEEEIKNIISSSWNIGEEVPNKGYSINITNTNNESVLSYKEGNQTNNYKGASQILANAEIRFKLYR